MSNRLILIVAALIVFLGVLFQLGYQKEILSNLDYSSKIRRSSSESMMQTVSVIDLRDAPLISLANIHIEPPGFDVIRALMLQIWPAPDPINALFHVDYLLYKLWGLLYGILGLVIFLWLQKWTEIKFALVATVLFLLHPASILYSIVLETTLLTTLFVLLFYYLLWEAKNGYKVSLALVVSTILVLFFLRPIFQIPFILVAGLSFFLVGMPKRAVLIIMLITGSTAIIYMAKQYIQFGSVSTSSFTGLNLNRSIGDDYLRQYKMYLASENRPVGQEDNLPSVLTRKTKLDGSANFNNIEYLQYNQQLIEQYKAYMLSTPLRLILRSYVRNSIIYFRPSSKYVASALIASIPWRTFYDTVFSSPVLVLCLLFSGILWLKGVIQRRDYLASMGLILPALYIFLVSILFESGENYRFKYFLEPVFYIFMLSQFYGFGQSILRKIRSGAISTAKPGNGS